MTIINDIRNKDHYLHTLPENRELLVCVDNYEHGRSLKKGIRILYYYPALWAPLLKQKGNSPPAQCAVAGNSVRTSVDIANNTIVAAKSFFLRYL